MSCMAFAMLLSAMWMITVIGPLHPEICQIMIYQIKESILNTYVKVAYRQQCKNHLVR
jgi:hypothetical protein